MRISRSELQLELADAVPARQINDMETTMALRVIDA